MRTPKIAFLAFAALPIGMAASGCSLSAKSGDPSLHVDLSALRSRASYSLLDRDGGLSLAPPSSLSGFKCYAVNVTGPGIPDSSRNPDGNAEAEFLKTLSLPNYHCAYRGVVSPPVRPGAAGADLALQIPPGNLRLVQVVGVNSQYLCDTGIRDDDPNASDGPTVFELGRAVLRDVFQDQSVSIVADWATGITAADEAARMAKSMDCGDGICGFPSNHFDVAGTGTYSAINGVKKVAQLLAVPTGTYLRRVDLRLDVVTAGTVQVAICQEPSANAPSAGCEASALFKKEVPVAAGAGQVVSFDLRHATYGFLQTQSGSGYFAVVSAVGGVDFQLEKLVGTPPGGSVHLFSGSTWLAGANAYALRLYGCGQ